jgi:hypothetical protein
VNLLLQVAPLAALVCLAGACSPAETEASATGAAGTGPETTSGATSGAISTSSSGTTTSATSTGTTSTGTTSAAATTGTSGGTTGGATSSSTSSGGIASCDAPGQIFDVYCTKCHYSGAENGLDLTAPCQLLQPNQALYSVCTSSSLIVPGEPSASLIWQMVTCTGNSCPCVTRGFSPMPYQPNSLGIGPLDAAQQACIADWISSLDGGLDQCQSL